MHYQPHFSIQLFHDYYQNKTCTGLTIEPTISCKRMLQNHRLVLKSNPNSLQSLIPLQPDNQPLVSLDKSAIFTFLLKLSHPDFLSFTDLDPDYQPSSLYVFSNENLKATDSFALASSFIQQERLAQSASGRSPLENRCATISEVNGIQRSKIFGIIEIHNNTSLSQDFSQNSKFSITFTAKQQVWSYYLVTNKGTDTDLFSIQDVVKNGESPITFSQTSTQTADPVAASIQSRFPDSQPILLRSEQPIFCREIAKPNLQLIKDGHTKPWIPHLPNPPNNHGTQVINLLDDM